MKSFEIKVYAYEYTYCKTFKILKSFKNAII